MNVNLPKKPKMNVKAIVIYTVSMIVCMIAVIIIGLSMYFGSNELDRLVTIGGSSLTKEDTDYQLLASNFDEIFQNQLEEYTTDLDIKKIDEGKDYIYTYYTNEENEQNSYDLDLNIPYINIDNEIIAKYNEEIKQTYVQKAEDTLKTENQNIIYSLEYEATIENDILSLMIRANLKQGSNAQRLIIQTFNYDLKNNKEVTLEEILSQKQLNKNEVQDKIKDEIVSEQQRVEDLISLGYSIFERNPNDEMYHIENSQEFFIKDGKIYIIYAYGNENLTREMDLVII